MGKACYTKEWCPGKMFMALNVSRPSPTMKTWIKKYKSRGGAITFSNLFNFNALNGKQKQEEMVANNRSVDKRTRSGARSGVWSDVYGNYMAEESLWKEIDPLTGE